MNTIAFKKSAFRYTMKAALHAAIRRLSGVLRQWVEPVETI